MKLPRASQTMVDLVPASDHREWEVEKQNKKAGWQRHTSEGAPADSLRG